MKSVKNTPKTKDAYKPSRTLTKYLDEKLQVLNLERESKRAGKLSLDKNQKKKELNQRNRVHVLNRHIFESMANLITFFEFVRSDYKLLEEFHDEIKELLMGVRLQEKQRTLHFIG